MYLQKVYYKIYFLNLDLILNFSFVFTNFEDINQKFVLQYNIES